LTFLVLEGFSGTGKTTLAKTLEDDGWLRLAESAHVVPNQVPVAERANTYADYSLFGAAMQHCSMISSNRSKMNIVAEGYFISDLAYARIRYILNLSDAFPELLNIARMLLQDKMLQPDLFVLLSADPKVIDERQGMKTERDRNVTKFFRIEYYNAIEDLHRQLGLENIERVTTDSEASKTSAVIRDLLDRRGHAPERAQEERERQW
jgi:thymidylate kinase